MQAEHAASRTSFAETIKCRQLRRLPSSRLPSSTEMPSLHSCRRRTLFSSAQQHSCGCSLFSPYVDPLLPGQLLSTRTVKNLADLLASSSWRMRAGLEHPGYSSHAYFIAGHEGSPLWHFWQSTFPSFQTLDPVQTFMGSHGEFSSPLTFFKRDSPNLIGSNGQII